MVLAEATLEVTVTVATPAPSLTVTSASDRMGVVSLSVIVIDAVLSDIKALDEALDNVSVKLSDPSNIRSFTRLLSKIEPEVAPPAMVNVPEAAVKSAGIVAVPALKDQSTVVVPMAGPERLTVTLYEAADSPTLKSAMVMA